MLTARGALHNQVDFLIAIIREHILSIETPDHLAETLLDRALIGLGGFQHIDSSILALMK